MNPVVIKREVFCTATPERLWDLVANTERLNRAVGMSPLKLVPLAGEGAARYLVRTRLGGFPVEYEEQPFEWCKPRRFGVRRRLRSGPLRELEFSMVLEPAEGGTRVELGLRLWPRFAVVVPVAHVQGRLTVARFAALVRELDGRLARGQETAADRGPRVVEAALLRAEAVLRSSLPAAPGDREPERGHQLLDRLLVRLRSADDTVVDRLRPYALAREWGAAPAQVLALCLQAVSAGLLELSWDLICPSCRTASARLATLADLGESGHCHLCDISFGLDLDRAVEATFRPAPAVRVVDVGPYCIGGPALTPHVVAQAILPAAPAEVELPVPRAPGRYRLFGRGGSSLTVLVEERAAPEVRVCLGADAVPPQVEVAAGGRLLLSQAAGGERHVKLEESEWASLAATAYQVTLDPAFRRLFGKEVLKPGLSLKVARVTLLFSDLTGSTALYSRIGDARAFRLVQDHFELLHGIVAGRGGVVVKTIGDAVMAAFPDEAQAAGAAVEAQRGFTRFRKERRAGPGQGPGIGDVSLKLGLFAGPCYVVTANGVLDYFGQTANTAARLQGLAGAGEIVLPEDLYLRALPDLPGPIEVSAPFPAVLKGLDRPVTAVRLLPGPG